MNKYIYQNLNIMNKYIYLNLLVCFLLSLGTLSAQVIVDRTNGASANQAKIEPIFDKTNYVLHSGDDNQKVYVKDTPSNPSDKNNLVKQDVTLTINLDFNPDDYFPNLIIVVDESGYLDTAYWEGTNPLTLSVPTGEYDLIVSSILNAPNQYSFVIKEQQNITEDTEFTIQLAEAQNYIQMHFLDENGDDLKPFETPTGTKAIPSYEQHLFFNPVGISVHDIFTSLFFMEEEWEDFWNIYINDVSDRYSYLQAYSAVREDGSFFASKFDVIHGFSGPLTLQNNPEDYVFQEEKFQPSPMAQSENNYLYAMKTIAAWDGRTLGGFQIVDTNTEGNLDQGTKVFTDSHLDTNPFQLLVAPSLADYVEGSNSLLISGNPIVVDADNEISYGSGSSSLSLGSQLNWVYGSPLVLPFNPQFTFAKNDNPTIIQGDNAPLINVFAGNYQLGNVKRSEIQLQSIGRYGEVRENDRMAIAVTIKYNNDVVYSGDVLGLQNFLFQWSLQNHPDGVFDVTMSSTNSEVDGIQGNSITQITYDWTKEDWTAPSVQRLQFRDSSGKVTDRFNDPSEGTVRLATGDFEYDLFGGKFDYNEGNSIAFYYGNYAQDDWTALELTERPEYFFMPGFGDYYEASLESIQQQGGENIWYDVKIVCTDAAGNSQMQIVSPAFYIGEELGTNEFSKSEALIYPNPFNDVVYINLPEKVNGNYTLSITDITGRVVHSENKKSDQKHLMYDGAALPSGVYILKVKTDTSTIAEKVIKK